MAVVLFNKDGQSKICNEFSYLHLLEDGWYYTQKEAEEAEKNKKDEKDKEASNENDLRAAAKEAGISHWHTKSIDRLENELKDLENAERS